jgi:7-cyano-7-deazaguanine synthase
MKLDKLVLAFSGGMDSSVLLFMAAERGYEEIHTVTFDYGQRHRREMQCVPLQKWDLEEKYPNVKFTNKVLDVSYLKDISPTSSLTNLDIDNPDISKIAGDAQPVSYVPFRNQMFITICCAYAESLGADTVWYGAAQVDSLAGYWDTTESFVELFNSLVAQNRTSAIKLEAPLLTMSKEDIVQKGIDLEVKFENTWTCYSNHTSGLADITTPSSSLRVKGFIDAGYRDPIKYIQQDKLEEIYERKECKYIN